MRYRSPLILVAVVMIIGTLAGCAPRESTTVVLWSHRVDIAAIIELYNAQNRGYKVEMRFVPNPSTMITESPVQPDIIISDSIANQTMAEYFTPLGNIIDRGPIGRTRFYADLIAGGRIGGRQRLLPLSFDLPAVIFRQAPENQDLPRFMLHIDEIRFHASEFNQTASERMTRLGLSPRWDPEFLYMLAKVHGTRFHEENRNAAWNEERLRASIEYTRDWIASDNGGLDVETAFTNRYVIDPKYQLLVRQRIRFAYTRAGDLFRFTDSQRQRIDYRWIRGDSGIPVLENVVFAGITQNAANRRGAQDLLEWLFQPDTHVAILESARSKRLPDFGIAGGFSSIPDVNERHLPRFYPALLGSIPREDTLVFAQRVPDNWHDIRRDVIEPWLLREVSSLPQPRSLQEEIRLWLLQRG